MVRYSTYGEEKSKRYGAPASGRKGRRRGGEIAIPACIEGEKRNKSSPKPIIEGTKNQCRLGGQAHNLT